MKKILLFIFVFYGFKIFSQSVENYTLQTEWQFRKAGDEDWLPATVPGTVHTDLLANKIIEDPYFRDNEKNLQWIEKEDWEYTTKFSLDKKTFKKQNIDLIFNGLDTYAKVYLNDSLILTADNMFRTWKVDCKKYLKQDDNVLYILFESPAKKTKDLNKNLPGGERIYTRKAAYQYGWDFGPRFVTCGVWRNIEIKAWDYFIINDAKMYVIDCIEKRAALTFQIEVISDEDVNLLTHIINENNPEENKYQENEIKKGKNIIKIDFIIKNLKLWWCNGLGKPEMHKFFIEATDNHERWHSLEINTGIRSIYHVTVSDAVQQEIDFKLNRVPVFVKGANWIPPDNFLPRVTKEKYEELISDAAKSGINMFRVWGGGVYEDDIFYELCDKYGILVWQDFMFANAMYPGDNKFIENVKQEATDNMRRLQNHPCMAIWCGNNEIEEGWRNWGWQKEFNISRHDSDLIWNNYYNLFYITLPELMDKYGTNQSTIQYIYLHSSPRNGWGRPESMQTGDAHYWGVWWGMEPFEVYKQKVPRFMSEYGFQGFPDIKTIEEFTNFGDRYLHSDVMMSHQKHPTGYETIQTYLEREYKTPEDFEKYNYVSQLLQAYGIKTAIEAHRRAKPYCMGTMYWQYNDCWPGVTWSGIDYSGRWKALQYFVKDLYKDVLVSTVEDNEEINVHIVSDRTTNFTANLNLKLQKFNGDIVWSLDTNIQVTRNSGTIFFEIEKSKLLNGEEPNSVVLSANLRENDESYYDNKYYFSKPKELNLPESKMNLKITSYEEGFYLDITAFTILKNLYFYASKDVQFDKNYFDILPGEKGGVYCKTKLSFEDFTKYLRYLTLNDIYLPE